MTGLDEVADISISSAVHDVQSTEQMIQMVKRRRSSAANSAAPSIVSKRPPVKKKHNGIPSFELGRDKTVSKDACSKFSTLRDVALFALHVSDSCPKYIKIKNRGSLNSVVIVTIPGLETVSTFGITNTTESPQPLGDISAELPFFHHNFKELMLLSAPGDRDSIYPLMKSLAIRSFTKSEKTRITNKLKEIKIVIPDIKMSPSDLALNGYPVHPLTNGSADESPEGWVDTIVFEHEGSHTFAVDCEMCETLSGKVLTRVSLIDFDQRVVMDEYVKPDQEITDYLTQYSGITKEILSGVTTSLQDIQDRILRIISADDYLIGHSLENDLKVLKIRHPNIVDTSIVFEHPRGPPFKSSLKYLTKQHLQRTIQEAEHDSIEDAKACLDLVKLKLVEGGLLGKVVDGQPIFDDLANIEKRAVIIDQSRVQPNQHRYIQCHDPDDIVDHVIEKSKNHHLVIANLKADPDDLPTLDSRLSKIHRNIPSNTLFIVASGNGDQAEMRRMAGIKRQSPETWTTEDEEKLREVTKSTRLGVCFFKLV